MTRGYVIGRRMGALRWLLSVAAMSIMAAGCALGGLMAVPSIVAAQESSRSSARPAAVPFGVGERAEYSVSLGILGNVGEASMEVVGTERVNGHNTYHLVFDLEGKVLVGSVDDTFQSWLDVDQLFARRFHKRQHEIRYETDRAYDFFPESMTYRRIPEGEPQELASAEPLDEVSFLYFARTLPLEPGDVYTLNRYYKDSGNPVVLKVLRRETMKGSGGSEIPVVVVQPIIQTSGLFGEGGKAEVYFTDDWRRILVKMTSKVPVIGRLGLTLTGYTAGRQLDR